ncbi:MAG: tetratricopeptide repeat protein [Burkholderiaceae bacterium]
MPSRPLFQRSLSLLLLALLAGLATGCATTAPESGQPANAAPAASAAVPAPPPAEPLPNVDLNSGLMFQLMLSEIAAQRGNAPAAHLSFLQLARDTKDPRLARRAAELALAARKPDAALEAAQLWVSLTPNSPEAKGLTFSLLATNDKLDVLEPLLGAELKDAKDKKIAISNVQRATGRIADRKAGYAMAQRVLQPVQKMPEALLVLAQSAAGAQESAQAIDYGKRALATKPDMEIAALLTAQLMRAKPEDSIALLENFVAKNPGAREARTTLARLLAANKNLPKARSQFELLAKPVAGQEVDADALYGLGIVAMQQNDFDVAETNFKAFLAAIEEDEERDGNGAYFNLGAVAEERKDYAGAVGWYDKVDGDGRMGAQLRAATALAKQGRGEEAGQRLSAIKPRNNTDRARIAMTQAQIHRDAGKNQEAFNTLDAALKAAPEEPDLLYDWALAIEKLGKFDEMEKALRKVIELKPDAAHAYNALGYSLADRNVRLDEARQLIEKAVNLSPDDAFILDSLGWVQYRQGQIDQALKTLREAYAKRPDAEIGAHLGEVLWVAGKRNEAEKLWREAKKKDANNETLKSTLARYNVSLN